MPQFAPILGSPITPLDIQGNINRGQEMRRQELSDQQKQMESVERMKILQQQQQVGAMEIAQARIQAAQDQIRRNTQALQGGIDIIEGEVDPKRAEEVLNTWMKYMEKNNPQFLQNLPQDFRSQPIDRKLEYFKIQQKIGQSMLDKDPRNETDFITNLEYLERRGEVDRARAYADKFSGIEKKEPATPYTDIAKLTVDFKNGNLTEDQYKDQTDKLMSGTNPDAFTNEDKLRNEYNNLSKEYFDVGRAYQRIEASAKDPSPAGDLALIFNFMKMQDPTSVVRESEFATAENSGSVDDRTRALYNKVLEGTRLSESQRKDFVDRSKFMMEASKASQKPIFERYNKMAKTYGLNAENITGGTIDLDSKKNMTREEKQKRVAELRAKAGM